IWTRLNALQRKHKLILLQIVSTDLQRTKLSLSPELKPYFDNIIISGDFGSGKPDPKIFEYALEQQSLTKEDAIMIGDNLLTDILGASKLGMHSIWINHDDKEAKAAQPTYEIKRLKEVLPIIRELS